MNNLVKMEISYNYSRMLAVATLTTMMLLPSCTTPDEPSAPLATPVGSEQANQLGVTNEAFAAVTVRALLPPPNDAFAAATVLSALPVAVSGTTAQATREAGEPDHYTENKPDAGWWLGDHSVWYQWTAPGNGLVTVDVCTGAIDSIVAVYSGSTISNLSRITDNNNDNCGGGWGAKVTFASSPGVNYHIAVADAGGARESNFVLKVFTSECGNGIVEYGEQCDDGNGWSFDQCSPDCQHACTGELIWCDCTTDLRCMTQKACNRECWE